MCIKEKRYISTLLCMNVLDAAGKIPPGLMTGTTSMFGDYDECLSAEILRADGKAAFQGQYCMLDIRPILPKKKGRITLAGGYEDLVEFTRNTSEAMQFLLSKVQHSDVRAAKYGVCIPSGCSTEDVKMILHYLEEKMFINATLQYCDRRHELQIHPGMIVAISLFSVVGLLAVTSSFMDYYARKNGVSFKKNLTRFLMCFSVLTNFPKVISTKTQDTALTSVFGIRTLSLFFIILLHQYFCWGYFPVHGHSLVLEDEIPSFFTQIALNGLLTTDVFFFLGGLLNAYSRIKVQDRGKRQSNKARLLIHRLWRIYPTYIFSMLTFYLFVNVRGPLATFVKQDFIETCGEKWWKNILFINNFFIQEKTCMPHTWYVAVDMQLFLMSLFTVPVLLKSATKGIILHVSMLMAGLVATILWAWYKDLMPSIILYYLDQDDIQKVRNAYVTTLPHIAPYYTGLIVGYILSNWNKVKIPKIYQYFGWPIAAACFLSMLFITQRWNSGVEFNFIESAFYFAFSRLFYVLAVAWMVVCCASGCGGILNYILSLKIWIPFARISYMVYMISPLLQLYYYANLRMRIDMDYMTLIWRHIGDLGVSCLMGLAMVVTIESPFISMEKLIFHKSPSKTEGSVNNTENNTEEYINNDEIVKKLECGKDNKIINVNIQLKE